MSSDHTDGPSLNDQRSRPVCSQCGEGWPCGYWSDPMGVEQGSVAAAHLNRGNEKAVRSRLRITVDRIVRAFVHPQPGVERTREGWGTWR